MQKHTFFHFLFFLLAFFLIAGCGLNRWSKDPQHYIVDITGMESVFNYSKPYPVYESRSTEKNDTVTIAVSEGDILWLINSEYDEEFLYRYNPDDGLNLYFSFDTANDALYLNNDIISVFINKESTLEWIEQSDAEIFNNLRFLGIPEEFPATEITVLEKISEINSNLVISNGSDTLLQYLCTLFIPKWHFAEVLNYYNSSEEAKSNLNELELVWMNDYDSSNFEILYDLPKLNSLIIESWDSSTIAEFQFDKLKRLRSLCIMESDIYDLSSLGILPKLKDLNIIDCESLEEIGTLVDFTEIKSIGFTGCKNIKDISIIKELPFLTRLSLPVNTGQEEFSNIVDKQSSLQVFELIRCEDITDLTPLEGYSGLKALSLDTGFTDFTPLFQMKDLELLVLGKTYFEDSLKITELQNALPETKIIPGGGFCLGSGWILLLVPIFTLFIVFKIRYKKYSLAKTIQ